MTEDETSYLLEIDMSERNNMLRNTYLLATLEKSGFQ